MSKTKRDIQLHLNERILEIQHHIQAAYNLSRAIYDNQDLNIFTKEGYIEMIMSQILVHKWNPDMRNGPDAWEWDGTPTEYKSTQGFKGIQFCGLNQDGIDKFNNHNYLYHAEKDGVYIKKIHKYKMKDIQEEMQRKFNARANNNKFQCTIGANYLKSLL